MDKFIIGIKEHQYFGYIPVPLIVNDCTDEYCKIKRIVVFQDVIDDPDSYSSIQKEILSIIDNISDEKIYLYFNNNKKLSVTKFIASLEKEYIEKVIRPYIEKHIAHLFKILKNNDIEIYYKPYRYEYIYHSDKITLSDKPANAVFNFEYDEEGIKYYLTVNYDGRDIKIYHKKPIILLVKPALIELEHILMYIPDIDANKLRPFYDKEFVRVPKEMTIKYMDNFVKKIIRDYEVVAKGFEIINASTNKQAELWIENDWFGEYAFIPKFNYNGRRFKPSDQMINFVEFDKEKMIFTKFHRDLRWELKHLNSLIKLGLLQKNDDIYKIPCSSKDKAIQHQTAINWLNKHFGDIEQQDWRIVQNFSKKQYFVKDVKLDFKIEKKIDWFDIKAKVIIGEFEIPFYKFKNHILEGNKEYELPNGEIFIIPSPWFKKYKPLLKYAKKGKDQHLSLKKTHYRLLEETGHTDYVDYDTDKLHDFFNNPFGNDYKVPQLLKTNLRNYQKIGYSWLNTLRENQLGGILADDMGLGKTVQILASILKMLEDKKQILPKGKYDEANEHLYNLVIVPRSLLHNWVNEIKKNTPSIRVLLYAGNDREQLRPYVDKVDIIVASYGIVRNDIDFFKEIDFSYIVLDESQYIKNPNSKTYQAIKQIKGKYKVSLTGTPIENSLRDLWAQLNFLNPGLLGSFAFYRKNFINPIEKNNDQEAKDELKKLINPFVLRRSKTDVLEDLPDLEESIVICEMADNQKLLYEEEKSKVRNKILEIYGKGKLKQSSIYVLQALTKLRQIANHPAMAGFEEEESGKFDEIINRLEILQERGHKVLIFSSFVSHLEIFEKYFSKKKWKYEKIIGKTTKRQEAIENFQKTEDINFFLISIKAGGVGINLTAADYVFILDPWWNPAVEQQAIARAHRIGQENKVFVYKFITFDTVEEKILKLQDQKKEIFKNFIDSNNYFKYFPEQTIIQLFE